MSTLSQLKKDLKTLEKSSTRKNYFGESLWKKHRNKILVGGALLGTGMYLSQRRKNNPVTPDSKNSPKKSSDSYKNAAWKGASWLGDGLLRYTPWL